MQHLADQQQGAAAGCDSSAEQTDGGGYQPKR
jgi:hypothetical protein